MTMRVAIAEADKENQAANVVRMQPAEWVVEHAPAVDTRATITKAGESGRRHVILGLAVHNDKAPTTTTSVLLKFGSVTVWTQRVMTAYRGVYTFPGGLQAGVGESVTLEYADAPASGGYETVAFWGYTR